VARQSYSFAFVCVPLYARTCDCRLSRASFGAKLTLRSFLRFAGFFFFGASGKGGKRRGDGERGREREWASRAGFDRSVLFCSSCYLFDCQTLSFLDFLMEEAFNLDSLAFRNSILPYIWLLRCPWLAFLPSFSISLLCPCALQLRASLSSKPTKLLQNNTLYGLAKVMLRNCLYLRIDAKGKGKFFLTLFTILSFSLVSSISRAMYRRVLVQC
jgi:hypothetical protein